MNLWFVLGCIALGVGIVGSWVPWMIQGFRTYHDGNHQIETHDWVTTEHNERVRQIAIAPLLHNRGGHANANFQRGNR